MLPYVMAGAFVRHVCLGGSEGNPQFRAQQQSSHSFPLPTLSTDSGFFFSGLSTSCSRFYSTSPKTLDTTLLGLAPHPLLNCCPSLTTKCLRDQRSGRASRLSL